MTELFQDSGTFDDLTARKTGVVFYLLQVIASRTFTVFFLRLESKSYEKWIVVIAQWSLIGAIVIGGPATVRTDEHGPYCERLFDRDFFKFRDHFSDGLVGDLCWIAANYTVQRIMYVFKIYETLPEN